MTTAGQVFDSFISRGVDVIIDIVIPPQLVAAQMANARDKKIRSGTRNIAIVATSAGRPDMRSVAANATLPWLTRFAGPRGLVRATSEISEVSRLRKRLDLRPLKGALTRGSGHSPGQPTEAVIARGVVAFPLQQSDRGDHGNVGLFELTLPVVGNRTKPRPREPILPPPKRLRLSASASQDRNVAAPLK